MRGFQYTILVLVVLTLSVQIAHFSYLKFLYPTSSVLDEQIDDSIRSATSLAALLGQYRKSKLEIEEYEKNLSEEEKRRSYRRDIEAYETSQQLRNAISDWERKQEQHSRLLFQWAFGLAITIVGSILHRKLRRSWLGSALIVAGLAEMIWWSSPSITLLGATSEFERILNTKLLLTLATCVVFAGVWRAWNKDDHATA